MRLEDCLPQNLRDKLEIIKGKAEPLLAKIIEVFPEYTIHDIRHSEKVIEILDWFIPDELKSTTMERDERKRAMNEWDVFFLLCAAIFHDCGMAKLPELEEVDKARIRETHHLRSETYVRKHWRDLGFDDAHQAKFVGRLCRGHREKPSDRRYKRREYRNAHINTPALVMFLQIADALDLTFERTPWEYYEKIYPNLEPISQQEWERQMATSGAGLAPEGLFINVDVPECKNPRILEACRRLVGDIQNSLYELFDYYLYNYSQYANYIPSSIRLIGPEGYVEIKPEIPQEVLFFVVESLDGFYKFTTDTHGFIERPFKDEEEWSLKKKQLYYFGEQAEIEQEFQTISAKLGSTNICLITGEPNSGKSTFLLFYVDECLKRNIDTLILFINPFIEAEVLAGDDGILNEIDRFITTQYRGYEKRKVLLAIDALRREESDENYIEKCDKLFEWAFSRGYRLIATVRSDQRDLLKKNFENMPINKWVKYNLKDGEIEVKPFNLEWTKKAVIRYLDFSPYEKIKPPELSFDSKEFNECVEIIARKSRAVIGDIAFIIEDIYISSQEFSKETLEKYPEGTVGIPSGYVLRWNTIRRDYYLLGDKVLPAVFLFLTYQNYSITKLFINKFIEWGIVEIDKGLLDRKQIFDRVENLLNFYCISTMFENVEQFRLRSDWREAIEKGLSDSNFEKFNLINDFIEIINTGKLVNWIVRFIFKLQSQLETGRLSYRDIETWYIIGDMAKTWGMNIEKLEIKTKLEVLKNVTNFVTGTLRSYPEIWNFGMPWNFIKKTFSLVWKRALNDVTPQHCDVAIEFYKILKDLEPEDFWASWMLGEFHDKKGEDDEALECYVDSANLQNTSKGFGSLIEKLRSKRHITSDDIQLEYLELREKAAIKAIECYAGNHRNWSDLAEALNYKGNMFVKQEKFRKALKNFDDSLRAYERGIEVIEKLTPRHKEDKTRYQKRIVTVLGKKAYVNAYIGKFEESIKDIKRAIEIKRLPEVNENTEEDEKWLFIYNERLVCREFVTQLLEFILDMANSVIKGEKAQELSDAWYEIKKLLDNLDPKYVGGDLEDLKISALHHSLRLNPTNEDAEQDLKNLIGDASPKTEENRYTAKYHEGCAESIKNQKQILEIFHRIFSTLIHTMRLTYHLRKGDIKGEKKERKNLSYRWGILGKRISDDFISVIPHKIAVRCFEFSVFFRPDNLDSWHNLGWEYLHDGKLKEAEEAFKKNLKLEEEKGRRKYSHLSKIGIGKICEEKQDAISAAKWLKEGAELSIKLFAKSDPPKAVDLLMKTGENLKNLTVLTILEDRKIEIMKDALDITDMALKISESAELMDLQRCLQEKIRWLERQIRWMKEKKMLPTMSLDETLEAPLLTLLSIKSEPERIETLYDREFAFSKLGEHEKSVEYADKILDSYPNNIFTWINKGTSLAKLKKYEQAIKCVEEVLKRDPANDLGLYKKGFYLEKLGRSEDARECYRKCSPNYAPARSKLLRLNRKIEKPKPWLTRIYTSLHASLNDGFKKGLFAEPAAITKAALNEVDNKGKLIKEINKLAVSWFKNIILQYDLVDSKEKLLFLLDEFKISFVLARGLNVNVPSLEEIKEKCMQSEKYAENKEKIKRIFG